MTKLSLEGTRGRIKDQFGGEVGFGSSFFLSSCRLIKSNGRFVESETVQFRIKIKSRRTWSLRGRTGCLRLGPGSGHGRSKSGLTNRNGSWLARNGSRLAALLLIVDDVKKILQSSTLGLDLLRSTIKQSRITNTLRSGSRSTLGLLLERSEVVVATIGVIK